jgi:hypothetical protein
MRLARTGPLIFLYVPLKDNCNQVATRMVIFDLSNAPLDAPVMNGYDWFTKPKPALLEFPFVPDFFLPSTTSSLPPLLHQQTLRGYESQDSSLEQLVTENEQLHVDHGNVLKFVDMCAIRCLYRQCFPDTKYRSRAEVEFSIDSRFHDEKIPQAEDPCPPHSKNVNAKSSRKRTYSASLASGIIVDTQDEGVKEGGYATSYRNGRHKRFRTSTPPSALPHSVSSAALSHNHPPSSAHFQLASRKRRSRVCHPAHEPRVNSVPRLGCPHCPYVQKSGRLPDLRRHIRAHERQIQEPEWVCCGIPVELAKDYKIPPGALVKIWGGREMIGGCHYAFSRRDAYKRHLAKSVKCVGDIPKYVNGFN